MQSSMAKPFAVCVSAICSACICSYLQRMRMQLQPACKYAWTGCAGQPLLRLLCLQAFARSLVLPAVNCQQQQQEQQQQQQPPPQGFGTNAAVVAADPSRVQQLPVQRSLHSTQGAVQFCSLCYGFAAAPVLMLPVLLCGSCPCRRAVPGRGE
jgi:hypothetical protein